VKEVLYYYLVAWPLANIALSMRRITHWGRMRHLAKGRDWRFYEQYSIGEILKMKVDGSETEKMNMWMRRYK